MALYMCHDIILKSKRVVEVESIIGDVRSVHKCITFSVILNLKSEILCSFQVCQILICLESDKWMTVTNSAIAMDAMYIAQLLT
jgi:hypothetical protein